MRVTTNGFVRATRAAAVAAALMSLTATTSAAQASGSRWQGWLGCWTAAAPDALVPNAAPLVCITPTSNADAVNVATVQGGKVLSTKLIDASGTEQPIELKDCTGTQRAAWSTDARRVYLKAVANCAGTARTTSGILAMSPAGEWLDVQGIVAGEGENVRVARYRDAGLPENLPSDIRSALEGRSGSVQGARIAAGANIGTAAVIEASKSATPAVVEAWLLERGQRFSLDAQTLVQLADAGVPARVTDALVAVSNPQQFAVAHPEPGTQYNRDDDVVTGRRIPVYLVPSYDPFGWGYTPYGYNGYGYGYPYGYGYGYGNNYGGYYGYPYFGSAPVIVVPGSGNVPGSDGGRLVKGQGYQPGVGRSTGRTAHPRNEPTPSDTRSAGSRGSSSAGSTGSSSAPSSAPAPSPAPTRTAHPRP